MDVFLKWRAKFRAIADLPVPQTPFMKIIFSPSFIASRISLTTSAWDFPFENFRGESSLPSLSNGLIEFGLFVFLYNDHIGENR